MPVELTGCKIPKVDLKRFDFLQVIKNWNFEVAKGQNHGSRPLSGFEVFKTGYGYKNMVNCYLDTFKVVPVGSD